jgi:phenylacetate-coenzyme A ligase PaaK-like adenylate-forming protein
VGLTASAQLAMPMAIERSLGKAKRIVDRRSKE